MFLSEYKDIENTKLPLDKRIQIPKVDETTTPNSLSQVLPNKYKLLRLDTLILCNLLESEIVMVPVKLNTGIGFNYFIEQNSTLKTYSYISLDTPNKTIDYKIELALTGSDSKHPRIFRCSSVCTSYKIIQQIIKSTMNKQSNSIKYYKILTSIYNVEYPIDLMYYPISVSLNELLSSKELFRNKKRLILEEIDTFKLIETSKDRFLTLISNSNYLVKINNHENYIAIWYNYEITIDAYINDLFQYWIDRLGNNNLTFYKVYYNKDRIKHASIIKPETIIMKPSNTIKQTNIQRLITPRLTTPRITIPRLTTPKLKTLILQPPLNQSIDNDQLILIDNICYLYNVLLKLKKKLIINENETSNYRITLQEKGIPLTIENNTSTIDTTETITNDIFIKQPITTMLFTDEDINNYTNYETTRKNNQFTLDEATNKNNPFTLDKTDQFIIHSKNNTIEPILIEDDKVDDEQDKYFTLEGMDEYMNTLNDEDMKIINDLENLDNESIEVNEDFILVGKKRKYNSIEENNELQEEQQVKVMKILDYDSFL